MPDPNWTADNVTECAVLGHWSNGRQVANIVHVRREEDDPATSARDVLNNWQDHMRNEVPNNYVIDGVRYRDRNVADGVVGFLPIDPAKGSVGGASGASTPPNTSVLVHKNTETTAGKRKGRLYLPGAPEAEIDEDGMLSTTLKTAWTTALNDFFAGLSGAADNELVVVHFAGPTDATGEVSVVTSLTVDPKMATQRRRLRK